MVVQAARDLGLSWPTVMDAFRAAGQAVTAAALEPVEVLGIDETRRGRMQWRQNPQTGRWEPAADRRHTGFVDAFGVQGLLGQVEGRAPSDVPAWLATTPLPWRRQIRYVAIDMAPGYRAAIRTGLLHATIVVDHFHVVQLANKMLNTVRRRTTAAPRDRRGRACDPEWKAASHNPTEPATILWRVPSSRPISTCGVFSRSSSTGCCRRCRCPRSSSTGCCRSHCHSRCR
ncbi:ISL3 family transposase [Streptomyces sp. HC307]|uniref:ISL3 family transposase n=1 Tax=Streptomyces flavusporus TaxID=3385496 RepID=UPI0039175D64